MKKIRPLAEQLARHLDKSDGPDACWPWQGTVNGGGYGKMTVTTGLRRYAHRVSWELVNGPIPKGLNVLHHCDNPPCCNPAHLWIGTQRDNMNDKVSKGRHDRGETHPYAVLSAAKVIEIRASSLAQAKLAEKFGVSRQTIGDARTGRTWKHIP